MTEGTMEDITVGTDISVNGAANPDGNVTASTIQIQTSRISDARVPLNTIHALKISSGSKILRAHNEH